MSIPQTTAERRQAAKKKTTDAIIYGKMVEEILDLTLDPDPEEWPNVDIRLFRNHWYKFRTSYFYCTIRHWWPAEPSHPTEGPARPEQIGVALRDDGRFYRVRNKQYTAMGNSCEDRALQLRALAAWWHTEQAAKQVYEKNKVKPPVSI